MITVMVLQQCGETGLRIRGQIYSETESRAAVLAARGLVKILTPARKEEKSFIETKELKRKRKK